MKPSEMRNLSTGEIQSRLNDGREELMNLRFQMAIGGLTDHTRLRYTRRQIARLLTLLNERDQEAQIEGEE
jgi:large subunit ribosomal protein L29